MKEKEAMRASGVLLPVSALPSRYGIGSFSKEAFEFVDQLRAAGQKYWQILPLGPTGYGDSPYQSFSTYAGNPYYIDLETLIQEGLLTEKECEAADFGDNEQYVDYEKIYYARFEILRKAFDRFVPDKAFEEFKEENAWWLEDYSLYMAIKNSLKGISWIEWEDDLKQRKPEVLEEKREALAEEIQFVRFQQYEFSRQWKKLKDYANENGIRIIGEVTAEKVRIVQDADFIYREEVDNAAAEYKKEHGEDPSWMPNQYFAALTNMRSVGVMGDFRTYDYAVALRAVKTIDFMTAESAEIPYAVLNKVMNRIINEVKGVNRVFYDLTSKPPGTIEFE